MHQRTVRIVAFVHYCVLAFRASHVAVTDVLIPPRTEIADDGQAARLKGRNQIVEDLVRDARRRCLFLKAIMCT
jgi:hypothetical protein